jgi:hypothetical protein
MSGRSDPWLAVVLRVGQVAAGFAALPVEFVQSFFLWLAQQNVARTDAVLPTHRRSAGECSAADPARGGLHAVRDSARRSI